MVPNLITEKKMLTIVNFPCYVKIICAHLGKDLWISSKKGVIPAKAGIQRLHAQILSYKSSQDGLFCSIRFNFHALFHFFICFSLWKADSQDPWTSYQTRRWTLYFLVKPSTRLFLCSYTRLARSEVTPVYKEPFRLLQRI
jgi:hypothetical protein